jgi:phage shock protein PspC (stress-responsive transcriptional regulator)
LVVGDSSAYRHDSVFLGTIDVLFGAYDEIVLVSPSYVLPSPSWLGRTDRRDLSYSRERTPTPGRDSDFRLGARGGFAAVRSCARATLIAAFIHKRLRSTKISILYGNGPIFHSKPSVSFCQKDLHAPGMVGYTVSSLAHFKTERFQETSMSRKSFRLFDGEPAWLGGVCAGISYALAAPLWLVRLIFVVAFFAGVGCPLLIYFLLWFLVPKWSVVPGDFEERTGSPVALGD